MKETKIRIPDELYGDISRIADDSRTSLNLTIEKAIKFYRDSFYMTNKACFINEEILNVMQAKNDLLEVKLNAKTNKVLSEVAIQVAIQNQILAQSLEIDNLHLDNYRKNAVEFLKTNNRVFRLDEI